MDKQKSNSNIYWDDEVEDNLKIFLENYDSWSESKKNLFFNKHLYEKFYMLSENILKTYSNRYGFDRIEMKYENLAYDCVAEIYVKLRYFDPSKGTKAFSYFGTLVKNYLILASMKVSNKGKKKSNIEDFVNIEMENNFNFYEEDNANCVIAKEEGDQKAKVHMEDLRAILIDNEFTDIETDVINTFLVLYENSDNLDFYNKKYIYVLMNEMSNIDKKHFYPALKKFLLEYNKYYGEPLWN